MIILQVAKTAALKDKQLKVVARWNSIITTFTNSEDTSVLEKSLVDLKAILVEQQEVPTGVKRKDLVKTCRKKKFVEGSKTKKKVSVSVSVSVIVLVLVLLVLVLV